EALTAEDLAEILLKLTDGIEVVKILPSVKEAIIYFRHNSSPDLIFCDIQLGDGYSFEIFKEIRISAPVIFCTAYDEYALEAFKNNGIDYILKPFTKKTIKATVEKFKSLKARFTNTGIDFAKVLQHIQTRYQPDRKVSSLLINWKDKIIPIRINDIALFNIDFKMTQLITFVNQKYFVNHTLDELEEICGEDFYRANRQFLINRKAVTEALQYHARKLVLKLKVEDKHEIIISKNRIPEFLSWLRS
ncbi:MAG: LytR/AlgR family response regulator transcription factor, partial [Chitinophagaceae bacterium]